MLGKVNGMAECTVWTQNGDHAITVQALVIPTITVQSPTRRLDRREWKHLLKLEWADPSFDRPGP